jgi:hypothetical protein
MSWKQVKIAQNCKLMQVHNFTYLHKGTAFQFEVDEYLDGAFTGHGEQTNDKSFFVEPVTAKSLNECLQSLIDRVEKRLA